MIKLQRLGHVLMTASDLERSKRFYIDVLGFELLEEDPEHGGVFLRIGDHGNTLDLFPSTDTAIDKTVRPRSLDDMTGLGVQHMAFAVATEADLVEAHAGLRAAGVEIHRAFDHESQKSVYFHDPDGNILEIVWERPDAVDIFKAGRSDNDTPLTFD